jgi:hypothetical protein
MISRYALPSLGITFVPSQSWTNIHEKTADIAIGLIAVHLAIDWRWITTVTKRLFHLRNARSESRDHAEG